MFSQNIMIYVCVLCFSVNAGLFTFPMMSLIPIGYWIDDVIAVGGAWSPIFSWDQLTLAQSTEHPYYSIRMTKNNWSLASVHHFEISKY